MSTDVVVLLDHQHGCALIAGHDGGAQAGGAGAHDDDIRDAIPLNWALGANLRFSAPDAPQGGGPDTEGRTILEEPSSSDPTMLRIFGRH